MGSATWDKILANYTDYRSQTDLYDEYSIAETQNAKSVQTLFRDTFELAKGDYKYLTELVMVLSHKMWYWYEINPSGSMVSAYSKCFEKAHNWALTHLNSDEIRYYKEVTD